MQMDLFLQRQLTLHGTPNKNDADLWADDGIAETDKSVKDMGTSLGVDDLSLENQAKLLGHTYVKAAAGRFWWGRYSGKH